MWTNDQGGQVKDQGQGLTRIKGPVNQRAHACNVAFKGAMPYGLLKHGACTHTAVDQVVAAVRKRTDMRTHAHRHTHAHFDFWLGLLIISFGVCLLSSLGVRSRYHNFFWCLFAVIIGREITISALREWAATLGPSARGVVAVNNMGKWKTAAQVRTADVGRHCIRCPLLRTKGITQGDQRGVVPCS